MDVPQVLGAEVPVEGHEEATVIIVVVDRLLAVASGGDVIDAAGDDDSGRSWHLGSVGIQIALAFRFRDLVRELSRCRDMSGV